MKMEKSKYNNMDFCENLSQQKRHGISKERDSILRDGTILIGSASSCSLSCTTNQHIVIVWVIPLDFIHSKEMRIDIYGKILAHLNKKKTKTTFRNGVENEGVDYIGIIRYSLHPVVVNLLSIHHIGICMYWSVVWFRSICITLMLPLLCNLNSSINTMLFPKN